MQAQVTTRRRVRPQLVADVVGPGAAIVRRRWFDLEPAEALLLAALALLFVLAIGVQVGIHVERERGGRVHAVRQ